MEKRCLMTTSTTLRVAGGRVGGGLSRVPAACTPRQRNGRTMTTRATHADGGRPTASATSTGDDLGRRQALSLLAMGASATVAGGEASAKVPAGYSPVKNVQKGYAFLYPFGWQEVSVDGAEVTVKDIIEPLESLSLEILPTNKESITDYGAIKPLAENLVKQVLVPPTQEGTVLNAEERENEGLKYYTIEYTAKAKNFTRHSLTVLAVQKGKLYTITTGANERRWPKMQDKLKFIAKSFTLL
mmetsp:Transcript_4957/g.17387  ORF Transcript_4957/g.17387 Transcript_4957/m.17387 type:complete len:243 (-) Transcript_4957:83-811(-)